MAWERRKRGGLYYTRSIRQGGRVVRRYYGRGEVAALIAALDAEEAEERRQKAEERQMEREPALALERTIRGLTQALGQTVASSLEAEGFHRHKGQWRRRRR